MHISTNKSLFGAALLAIMMSWAGFAYAQINPFNPGPRTIGAEQNSSTNVEMGRDGMNIQNTGSSSMGFQNGRPPFDGRNGTSSRPQGKLPPFMHGTSTMNMMPPGKQGFFGLVTEVDSSSFILAMRTRNATTTFTVNVSSSTEYHRASTTGTLADIKAGSMVVVQGRLATSTNTIYAARIILGVGSVNGRGDDFRKGTTTPNGGEGLMGRLKNFFGRMFGKNDNSKENTSSTSDSDSASLNASTSVNENSGFLGHLIHSLFGWLH